MKPFIKKKNYSKLSRFYDLVRIKKCGPTVTLSQSCHIHKPQYELCLRVIIVL